MSTIHHVERTASAEPDGLLVLHHGRGADERDLLGLADVIDPERRLHVVSPRGPLQLPDWSGYHWYTVPRVGYPDTETFAHARLALAELHDELWASTGIAPDRTVLGGFSMGAVMSYALALSVDRPAPAGIMAFSGFVPTVEGWRPSFEGRHATEAFIAHGDRDDVISVDLARDARELLAGGGLTVDYHESHVGHRIDVGRLAVAAAWLDSVLSGA